MDIKRLKRTYPVIMESGEPLLKEPLILVTADGSKKKPFETVTSRFIDAVMALKSGKPNFFCEGFPRVRGTEDGKGLVIYVHGAWK
jgi:hypothetical protein